MNNMDKFKMAGQLDKAVKMIEGDDQVREQKCLAALERVRNSFDCDWFPEFVIRGGVIMSHIVVVAKKRGPNNNQGNTQN